MSNGRPNVVVFFTDQQRWDTTGLHGNPMGLTPNLDRMARHGTHVARSFTCERDGWPEEIFAQISEAEVGRCVRTRRWKYGVRAEGIGGSEQPGADRYTESFLYDLQAAPYELTNLIRMGSHRPVAAVMRERLLRRMREAGEDEPDLVAPEIVASSQRRVDEAETLQ